jgi:intraflagellar transport protein 81
MHDKEESYAKQKGSKYMKRDDFRQYAANLRVKNTQYKTIVKQLDEVKSEVSVLFRTQTILKSRAENVDEFMADLEKKKGIVGYSKIDEQI